MEGKGIKKYYYLINRWKDVKENHNIDIELHFSYLYKENSFQHFRDVKIMATFPYIFQISKYFPYITT